MGKSTEFVAIYLKKTLTKHKNKILTFPKKKYNYAQAFKDRNRIFNKIWFTFASI